MNEIKCIRKGAENFWEDESGMGTVEMILIIVVLISIVIIFKTQITQLVKSIFATITEKSEEITG